MTLENPITEPRIPGAIARDSEVLEAILKTLSLFPRTSLSSVNGNSLITSAAAGFQWIDTDRVHTNLPATSGLLLQFDGLFGTAQQGLYRVQIFVAGTNASSGSVLYLRHQHQGNWASWRTI
jgi:hypothetical protein